jgi:carbamoylphosphate synthase large subunit
MNVIRTEKPLGVVAAFGGQTAINLTKYLDRQGVPILGTSADSIDLAEDRERFEELCDKLEIKRPKGVTVFTEAQALEAAARITYPVLLRPSYVLGGQNMIIANTPADVKEYMAIILRQKIENPVLIDKYMEGVELEIDGICDGEEVLLETINEYKSQLAEISAAIENEKQTKVVEAELAYKRGVLENLRGLWDEMTVVEKRRALRTCIERIVLTDEDIDIVYSV